MKKVTLASPEQPAEQDTGDGVGDGVQPPTEGSDGGFDTGPQKIEFTGKAEEMLGLCYRNAFFNIITLSLYRFWGRTHVRKYIWANIKIDGDPLDYTGTGEELFKGFLKALLFVFLPFGILSFVLQTLLIKAPQLGAIVFFMFYFGFIWLMYFGLYAAARYRMSRTVWRGIRGGQGGSAASFAWSAFGWTIVAIITFGIATPVLLNQLYTLQTNQKYFGTGRFSYSGDSVPLFGAFLVAAIASIIGFVLWFFVLGWSLNTSTSLRIDGLPLTTLFILYTGYFALVAVITSIYQVVQMNLFFNNTEFEGVDLNFKATLFEVIGLNISNILILVVSLGILFPVTQMRNLRFIVERLSLDARVDIAAISQSTIESPTSGEGLADGFDMGTI